MRNLCLHVIRVIMETTDDTYETSSTLDELTHEWSFDRTADAERGLEMDMLFETERLIVRKFKAEDARQLYENHVDEEVRKWFPNECYADPEEAQEAIRFYADRVDQGKLPFVLGAQLKGTGELIGDAGISEVEGRPCETEIGYCIGQKYRGKGCATELLRAVSGFAVSCFGIDVIWGRVVYGNEASVKVLVKNEYQFARKEFGAEDDPYGNGMLVYQLLR